LPIRPEYNRDESISESLLPPKETKWLAMRAKTVRIECFSLRICHRGGKRVPEGVKSQ
jgi:hypothetical protein